MIFHIYEKSNIMNSLSLLKCLSEQTRLIIVLLIDAHDEACVCELIDTIDADQPKVSRHLAELRKCKVLVDERRGKWVYYRLDPGLPEWAIEIIQSARNGELAAFESLSKRFRSCQIEKPCC